MSKRDIVVKIEVKLGILVGRPICVDFVELIKHLIDRNPDASDYHFVADQLNTHKSEGLVRFVPGFCEDTQDQDLGIKDKSGILKSMQTREDYFCKGNWRIVFPYTPKHASWMIVCVRP